MPTDRQRTACQRTPDFLLELAHAFPFSQFRMIWDLHCHLSGVPGRTPAERIEQLIAFADRMGIERICIFMGLDWSYDPSPEDMRKQNDDVLEALRACTATCRACPDVLRPNGSSSLSPLPIAWGSNASASSWAWIGPTIRPPDRKSV